MAENRCSCTGGSLSNMNVGKESVCIDTYRVLDSCRDKDCFENVPVYLTDFGQEIIDRTSNVRTKCAQILWSCITVDPVQFNRGFYQVTIRFYVKLVFEACVCLGRAQEFEGIAVAEKKVILYGSEGCVNIYRSTVSDEFCPCSDSTSTSFSTNMPIAAVEVANPVVLGTKVVEPSCCNFVPCCCCSCDSIPENVCSCVGGALNDNGTNRLYVSLGFFSIIRMERPAQYLVNVAEYCIPDKECVPSEDDDPCSLFKNMAFPVNEFYPPSLPNLPGDNGGICCNRKNR